MKTWRLILFFAILAAFIAIGSVAIAMGSNISPYLEAILIDIKGSLAPKGYFLPPEKQKQKQKRKKKKNFLNFIFS